MQVEGKVLNHPVVDLENREQIEQIDFKMVTFSLGGKDYGIDIMNVKEITRVNDFTYVPNTKTFVRGVYNLRGEIISIMDLRKLFSLEITASKDGLDDLLVLKGDHHMTGVVVDNIDRVVGVNSSKIQEPHPLFAEISIYFIKGIVDFEGRLYIILDVDRILSGGTKPSDEQIKEQNLADNTINQPLLSSNSTIQPLTSSPSIKSNIVPAQTNSPATKNGQSKKDEITPVKEVSSKSKSSNIGSVLETAEKSVVNSVTNKVVEKNVIDEETLTTDSIVNKFKKSQQQKETKKEKNSEIITDNKTDLYDDLVVVLEQECDFYVSDVNRDWIMNKSKDLTTIPKNNEETETFLKNFYSRATGELWSEFMIDEIKEIFSKEIGSTLYGWNVGCAAGYESYSIAVAFKERFPNTISKLWANDTDLVNISMAPTLSLDELEIPHRFNDFVESGKNGQKFIRSIVDSILFEYHDLTNENPYPDMDYIVARDFLSYISTDKVDYVIKELVNKLKPNGFIIVGENENISYPGLIKSKSSLFNVYVKKGE